MQPAHGERIDLGAARAQATSAGDRADQQVDRRHGARRRAADGGHRASRRHVERKAEQRVVHREQRRQHQGRAVDRQRLAAAQTLAPRREPQHEVTGRRRGEAHREDPRHRQREVRDGDVEGERPGQEHHVDHRRAHELLRQVVAATAIGHQRQREHHQRQRDAGRRRQRPSPRHRERELHVAVGARDREHQLAPVTEPRDRGVAREHRRGRRAVDRGDDVADAQPGPRRGRVGIDHRHRAALVDEEAAIGRAHRHHQERHRVDQRDADERARPPREAPQRARRAMPGGGVLARRGRDGADRREGPGRERWRHDNPGATARTGPSPRDERSTIDRAQLAITASVQADDRRGRTPRSWDSIPASARRPRCPDPITRRSRQLPRTAARATWPAT